MLRALKWVVRAPKEVPETPKKDQGLNFRILGHLYLHLVGEEKLPRAIRGMQESNGGES